MCMFYPEGLNLISIGVCTRIRFYVISTEGRNLKLAYFQYNKISRYARSDRFAEFSDSLPSRRGARTRKAYEFNARSIENI